jgi:Photosystem P840 reaction-centre cytochrome c-551
MLTLLLTLSVAAPPNARLTYEQKCLYCHSEEVAEGHRYTEGQWKRLVEQMRQKAPLLISRSDAQLLTKYITQTLKLVVPTPARPVPPSTTAKPTSSPPTAPPPTGPELKPMPELPPDPPSLPPLSATPEELPPPDLELDAQATQIIQQRCSKCHALGRVYMRLDTYERSMTTLERMRLKTGSGITDDELAVLERYLRAQF